MLSKNKIKLIKSLNEKKNRQCEGLFLAEGNKLVTEILNSDFEVETLIATEEFINQTDQKKKVELILATQEDLNSASMLKTPQQSLALVRIPVHRAEVILKNNIVLCLDEIQDPGNLGTIARLADWFGIRQIVCSENTVDIYNPKAVQATMGAICRITFHYLELEQFFANALSEKIEIFGTFPDGQNIYQADLSDEAIVVVGNEGNGINKLYNKYFSKRISIPNFSTSALKSESLNVSVATAIVCSEFKRRTIL